MMRSLTEQTPQAHWLQRFQRRTAGGRLVPAIDGLRFYAIAGVVLYHISYNLLQTGHVFSASPIGAWVARLATCGWFGVHLFFVISGYILGMPFAVANLSGNSPVNLKAYFLRRLTRLEPPFLLSLALLFLVRAGGQHQAGLLPHLLATSLYSHTLVYHNSSPISAVTWSLEVEVQFYILAPLLGLMYRIGPTWARRLTWLVALVLAHWLALGSAAAAPYPHIGDFLPYFLVGMLLADVSCFDWRQGREVPVSLLWDAVAIGAALALLPLVYKQEKLPLVLAGLVGIIDYAILRSTFFYRFTTLPLIFTIGGMCYTIYLYHNALIRFVIEWTHVPDLPALAGHPDLATLATALVAIPLLLLFSAAFFVAVERPCMNPAWPTRLLQSIRNRFRTL